MNILDPHNIFTDMIRFIKVIYEMTFIILLLRLSTIVLYRFASHALSGSSNFHIKSIECNANIFLHFFPFYALRKVRVHLRQNNT